METGACNHQVLYEQDGVFIHVFEAEEDTLTAGKLIVLNKPRGPHIEWQQTEETEYSLEQVHEWAMINARVEYKADKQDETECVEVKPVKKYKTPIEFDLLDLKSYKCSKPEQGWSSISFILKDGTTYPAMHFHKGEIVEFISVLERFIKVKKSSKEPNLYLLIYPEREALEKSFSELDLFGDRASHAVQDPYTATMMSFSRVTKLIDYVLSNGQTTTRAPESIAELLQESLSNLQVNHQEEPGFELITKTDLLPRPEVKRGPPLCEEEWRKYFDSEGRIANSDDLRQKIFRGGISYSIRSEVWKFLLGYYDFNSTHKDRIEIRKQRVDDYFRMKLQWKTISPEQERRFTSLREYKNLIEKDVNRTDRTHPFFEGQNNENVKVLSDILNTYCMFNFDLGYVQGMSDLLSPILVIMENEVDTFWCFVGFMERVYQNFEMDQQGMKTQLLQLNKLLRFVDASFSDYLECHESSNLYFSFRWLLILFKREFKFTDVMKLWEIIWTDLPCKNFHLFICLAILDAEKNTIMENKFGFSEILKHINDMSQHINLETSLASAESIFLQLKECSYLPECFYEITGTPRPQPKVIHTPDGTDVSGASAASRKSPQSGDSSIETSSIELLPDSEIENRYQMALDLQFL